MARARSGTAELARLLDAVNAPVYVLDEERAIVFANQACLDWVGPAAEPLQGQRCAYHTAAEAAGPEAVAAGLCPSPEALAGREMAGIVGCTTADGRASRRRARFIPLRGGDSIAGLVVLVEPDDLSEAQALAPAAGETEAARLHERVRSFRQQAARRYRVDRLAGDSPAIRRARAQIELAAASRANVLIVGPRGSGRQHAAAAIHYGGAGESAASLIPMACSVLGDDLTRSTLAALAVRGLPPGLPGRGTLLLNDADTLSPAVQPEVAKVLAARSFPLRVIAVAERRLADLVQAGQYREDLACVLSTLAIELAPLSQRRADLPVLLQLFLEEANARTGKQLAGFAPEAIDCLDAYGWPGNVDELIRVVNEAHQKAEGAQIGVRDLPQQIHLAAAAAAHPRRAEETIVLEEFLREVERELLGRAMARAKRNKTKAAKLLGITRPRLYRRLVQLGLEEAGGKFEPFPE